MRKLKRFTSILIAVLMVTSLFKGMSLKSYAIVEEEDNEILSTWDLVQDMGKGWNLGNTLDATGGKRNDVYSQETSWGNPQASKELINAVYNAGFNVVRIPTTWYRHIDSSNGYQIDEEWIARVKEVVDYAYGNGMYVILNLHHEEWINTANLASNKEEIGRELYAVWCQIANEFEGYDEKLIFEGMNEPRAAGTGYEWNGMPEEREAVNYLNQIFVNAVRDTGWVSNQTRSLMIPGYAASMSRENLAAIEIPTYNGKQDEHIIVSVHCYSPYEFCLTDSQKSFDLLNYSDTAGIKNLMLDLDDLFLSKGIPVIIGECGCTNTGNNTKSRMDWFNFMGSITSEYGVPAIVWDNGQNGTSGGECHSYFERKTGKIVNEDLIEAFIFGKSSKDISKASQVIDFEPYEEDGTTKTMTPKDAGFLPKELTNQAKVNHTEGAAVGFSMKVSEAAGFTAEYELNGYKGKNLIVKGYLLNENVDVMISLDDSDQMLIRPSSNWQKFIIAIEKDTANRIIFEGMGSDEFYMDDISFEITDEIDVDALQEEINEADSSNDDAYSEPESDAYDDTGEQFEPDDYDSENDSNISTMDSEEEDDYGNDYADDEVSDGLVYAVFAAMIIIPIGIIVLIIVLICRGVKKKKRGTK